MLPLKVKRAMEAIEKRNRKRKKIEKREKKEKKKKEKGGNINILYPHLCSCFSTCCFHSHHLCSCLTPILHGREFSCFTSITMWGIYTIELGLYIPMMSLLKSALGLREQPSWMHPH